MGNQDGSPSAALADRFIEFYGWNGIVYGHNVTEFLASISMSTSLLDRLPVKGECPSNRQDLLSLSWTRSNASAGLLSAVLDRVQTPACYMYGPPLSPPPLRHAARTADDDGIANSPLHVWGYGLLFVTLINLCAVLGIIFLPCMGRRIYKLLMTFMVSLAVGSLLATALLVLLPDALQLAFIDQEVNKENSSLFEDHHHHSFHADHSGHSTWEDFLSQHLWYLWRCCTVFGGVYLFFIIERLLKELIRWKSGSDVGSGHGHSHLPAAAASPTSAVVVVAEDEVGSLDDLETPPPPPMSARATTYGAAPLLPSTSSGGSSGGGAISRRLAAVQPLAWMILLGDALHNFIDGLSIGAAFTRSTLSGVSICLAVLCEELPHELGDFAILLSAGMSMPMALACNFLSACTCYIGFALGVLLGETGASVWVFAIASGMFLYISLVDMMPEVSHSMEEPEAKQLGRVKIFLLQNLGLFMGFGAILLLAMYGGNIKVGS